MPANPFREPTRLRIDDGRPVLPRLLRMTLAEIDAEDAFRRNRFRWAQRHLPPPNSWAVAGLVLAAATTALVLFDPPLLRLPLDWRAAYWLAIVTSSAASGHCLARGRHHWLVAALPCLAFLSALLHALSTQGDLLLLTAFAFCTFPLGLLQLLSAYLKRKNGNYWQTDGCSNTVGVEGALNEADEAGMDLRGRYRRVLEGDPSWNDPDGIASKLRDYDDACTEMHRSLREDGDIYHPHAPHVRPPLEAELELRRRMAFAYTRAFELLAQAERTTPATQTSALPAFARLWRAFG